MNTIITNVPKIRLNDSFFQFEIEEAQISIDMRGLFNTDNYSENAWINVTPILKSSWSPIKQVTKWLRNENLKSYINIVDREIGAYPIITKSGNNGGTWIHYLLIEEFMRKTLSPSDFYKNKVKGVFDFTNIKKRSMHKKMVYVILADDNTIKIGITHDIKRRFKEIENNSGKAIVNFISSDRFSHAYTVEQFILAYFDDYRTSGEWLKGVSFNTVTMKLSEILNRVFLNDFKVVESKVYALPINKVENR